MPQVDGGAGDRVALGVQHAALEEHNGGFVQLAAVVHPRLALADRRAGHVERALDGARGATGEADLLVLGVLQQVEEVLQAEASNQQAGFVAATQAVEVVDSQPELVLGHFEVLDDPRHVIDDAQHQLLDAGITAVVVVAADLLEEVLNLRGLGDFHGHFRFLELFL